MNIKTFKQYASGGFSYVDENNNLLGTGTTTDSAAPDPENLTGVFIYCQNPSRSLYASVSATNPVTVTLKDGTTTSVTNRKKLMEDLAEFFFYRVTTATAQDLDSVLSAGNNAGANNIDMNAQDITNVDEIETKIIKTQLLTNLEIQADNDIIFNPNGIIDANGKTLNMRNGEIHAAHLIHGRNNTDFKVQAKGTGDLIIETNNVERLKITAAGQFIGLPDAAGWSVIVKTANQDVTNSAFLVDDTELQFSVVAGGQYMTQLNLCYSGNNNTADLKLAYTLSAGTMKASGIVIGFSLGSSPANNQTLAVNGTNQAGPTTIGVVQSDIDNLLTSTIYFNFTASANAIIKFQFANNLAAPGAISRINKGSILKYKKIN